MKTQTQLNNDAISRQEPQAIPGFIRTSPYTGYWQAGWTPRGFSLRQYYVDRIRVPLMWLVCGAAWCGAVVLVVFSLAV